jgi:hypothetical protein
MRELRWCGEATAAEQRRGGAVAGTVARGEEEAQRVLGGAASRRAD